MISIVNYGLGNLGSITNMLKYIGVSHKIIERPDEIASAQKLLLPGVGAFDAGISHLNSNNWVDPLNEAVLVKKMPVLGICLGMQLMTKSSEEGALEGLKWIDADTRKFIYNQESNLKIPHMGWSDVHVVRPSVLFPDPAEYNRFYFVHSYYVKVNQQEDEITSTRYGIDYTSGFNSDNIFGVQFHPEKSHKYGMRLLQRFSAI